jgi:hypothetical protein
VGTVHAQGYGFGTPVGAKKMVEQAIAYIKANGEQKALQEFNKPNTPVDAVCIVHCLRR